MAEWRPRLWFLHWAVLQAWSLPMAVTMKPSIPTAGTCTPMPFSLTSLSTSVSPILRMAEKSIPASLLGKMSMPSWNFSYTDSLSIDATFPSRHRELWWYICTPYDVLHIRGQPKGSLCVSIVSADLVKINLALVIIGNGPTHNLRQYPIISVKGLIDHNLEREL